MRGPRVESDPLLSPILATVAAVGVALAVIVVPWDAFAGLDVDHAPVDWQSDFTAAEQRRSAEYRSELRIPSYLALAATVATALLVILTRVGTRVLRHRSLARVPTLVAVALVAAATVLAFRSVTLPFAAWAESLRRAEEVSTRSWGAWTLDVGRAAGLELVVTVVLVLAFWLLWQRMGSRWWRVAVPLSAAGVAMASFFYPVVVEPVFNSFDELPAGQARDSVTRVAERMGVEVSDVVVADASRRTSTLNAYVSGLGASRRVVVYDTLLETMPPAEAEQVWAHELAHVASGDVARGTVLGMAGVSLGVGLVALALQLPGLRGRSGIEAPSDLTLIPAVVAMATLLGVVAVPVQAVASRHIEARADVVGLDATRDAPSFVAAQRSLALAALQDVDPPAVSRVLFATHPTAPQRMAVARTWACSVGEIVPAGQVHGGARDGTAAAWCPSARRR